MKMQHCWASPWEIFEEVYDTSYHSCALFIDGFCLCLYGEKAEQNFTVFQIFNVFKAVFHGSFHYLSPYWPQQQPGKKTYCKAGNCHCQIYHHGDYGGGGGGAWGKPQTFTKGFCLELMLLLKIQKCAVSWSTAKHLGVLRWLRRHRGAEEGHSAPEQQPAPAKF